MGGTSVTELQGCGVGARLTASLQVESRLCVVSCCGKDSQIEEITGALTHCLFGTLSLCALTDLILCVTEFAGTMKTKNRIVLILQA